MTFRKLKIFVGVSLTIFIFIVGTVFTMNFLQKVAKEDKSNTEKEFNLFFEDDRDNVIQTSPQIIIPQKQNTPKPTNPPVRYVTTQAS